MDAINLKNKSKEELIELALDLELQDKNKKLTRQEARI